MTSITVQPNQVSLTVGTSTTVTASASTANCSSPPAITWASGNSAALSVAGNGNQATVTAVAATASPVAVTATSGGQSSSAQVTLVPPPAIALNPAGLTFAATQGGANPASQTATITNAGGGTLSGLSVGAITYGAGATGWLQAPGLSGTTASPSAILTVQPVTGTLAPGSYTATIGIQATGAANTPQNLTVTLTVTAAPAISLSPASLTFNASQGGANPASQGVTITNSGGGTLTALTLGTISYGAGATGWLQAPTLSGTTANPSVTFSVQPVTGALTAGSYTATIPVQSAVASNSPQSVTVTFTVTATTPMIAVNPASLAFSATVGGADPASQTSTISNGGGGTLSGLSIGTITYGAGATGWLQAPALSGTTANPSVTLTVQPVTGNLTPGSYSATVPVLSGVATNSPQTVTVTFTVTAPPAIALSPASLTFNATQGGANPASQAVTISNGGGGTLNGLALGAITYGAGATGWLQAPALSGTTANPSVTLTVQPLIAGLAAGSYTATIPVQSAVAGNSPQNVTVTFTVAAASGSLIQLDPSTRSFVSAAGVGTTEPSLSLIVIRNAGIGSLGTLSFGPTTYGAGASGWLGVSGLALAPPNPPGLLTLLPSTAATSLLAPGTYTATVPVQSTTAVNSPQSATITLTVVSASTPIIRVTPVSAFTASAGGADPTAQVDTISNVGGGTLSGLSVGTINYGSGASGWLQATLGSATANPFATLNVQPVIAGLSPGVYTATIPIVSAVAANSAYSVSVSLTVTASVTPQITLSASSRTFSANEGGANPSSQSVTITNGAGGTLSGLNIGTITYGAGATGWLQAPTLSGTTASPSVTLTIQPVLGSLAAGTYTATIPVQSAVASNSPQNVTVTLTVATPPPAIALNPATLTFNATEGGANPASQGVTITNSGGGTLSGLTVGTITYGAGASGWLQAPVLSGTTASPSVSLTVQPLTGSLTPGTYTATVPVQSAVAGNSPQNVTVTMVVAAAAVTYDGTWNGTTSQGAAMSFTVAGNAVTALTLGYSLSGNCSPAPTGSTVTYGTPVPITGNTIALTGNITLNGTFSTPIIGAGTFAVTFSGLPPGCISTASGTWTATLSASAPAIALNPGSLTYTATQGGTNPASQGVTITNSGSGTLSGLSLGAISYGAGASGWLQTPTLSGTTASPSVTLTLQPATGSLAPGTYTATVPVQSGVASNSPQNVTITFNVAAPPAIALSTASLTFNATGGGANPASQGVTITNSGGGTLSSLSIGTITYGAGASGWLQAPVLSGTTANPSVTLTAQPLTGALAAGTYTATIPIQSGVASNSPQNVTVTFVVATATVSYDGTWNGATSQGAAMSFTVAGNAVTALTLGYSLSGNCSPAPTGSTVTYGTPVPITGNTIALTGNITLNGTFSTPTDGAGTFAVTFSGLPPGCISTASGTWTATLSAGTPAIALNPGSLTYTATQGGANPASQGVTITNSGGGTLSGLSLGTISYGAGASGWLQTPTLSGTTASPSVTLTLQPATGSLAPGTYTATVPVQSGVASNSPQNVTVTFTVSATAPVIARNPASLTFSATQGGSNPASQLTTITNSGGGTLSGLTVGTITYGAGATGWLQAPVLSGTTASPSVTLTVQPVTAALAAGTYTATIPILSGAASNSPQNVTVTFTVTASAAIALNPTSMTFVATQGGANPASRTSAITNSGAGTLSGLTIGTVTYGAGATGWLQTPTLSGTTASPSVTLTVQPLTGSLAPGSYTATIPVQSGVASNSPQNVTVGFTVNPVGFDPCLFANALPISTGQTISGALSTATSCLLPAGHYTDLYVLTVATPTNLNIDLTASYDAFLSLLDFATGTIIEEDDDDGPGLNSHIARTLPAGQYILRPRSYSAGVTGAYSLSVQSVASGAPVSVAINAGNAQTAAPGAAVAIPPSVIVRDANGFAVPGVSVTFAILSSIGSITGAGATTDASGIATVGSWSLAAGPNVLSATASGAALVGNPVIFSATGSSSAAGYNVDLRFLTMPTLPQLQAFSGAVTRWQSIVTSDPANVSLIAAANACAANSPALNEIVDDLVIQVGLTAIDGPGGILGSAGPCLIRTVGSLPALGTMQFDVADLATLEASGSLNAVILHEMGHVIGIGGLWKLAAFNLITNPSLPSSPGVDTRFTGVNGIAGFDLIGGTTYTGGGKVPVENQFGGQGTQDSHWREGVLANELMTGFLNAGANPLSLLTVRSLEDLGYTVSAAAADPFFLTLTLLAEGARAPQVRLLNDERTGPIFRVDEQGRITDLQGRPVLGAPTPPPKR